MATGIVRVTPEFIAQLLLMPENWRIRGVAWDASSETIELTVEGENVPAGHDGGEVRGAYLRHTDEAGEHAMFVRWKAAE